MADDYGAPFVAKSAAGKALAAAVRGDRRRNWAQCTYQGFDRSGISHWNYSCLRAADRKLPADFEVAADLYDRGVFCCSRSLAGSGDFKKSGTGGDKRFFLVLFHQRSDQSVFE